MFVLAHTGHWAVSLIYVTPIVIVAVAVAIATFRERRRHRKNERSST